jgi:homoserine O-acetyltransferase
MHHKFGRRLETREHFGFDFETDFAIEGYLRHKGSRFTERFDANSYLYVTKALDYFDLCNGHGSLAKAFERSNEIVYLVISFTSDWLYPTYHSRELVSALTAVGADVTYLNIESSWGHDAFLLEVDTMTHLISSFLERVGRQFGVLPHELRLGTAQAAQAARALHAPRLSHASGAQLSGAQSAEASQS